MPQKLGKPTDQRMAILKNQVSHLLWYGKIETTYARAKSVRTITEKLITKAMRTYTDTVKVTKERVDSKGKKIKVDVINDGPKKLAARRRLIASLYDIPEVRAKGETKNAFRIRTEDIAHPLIEKVFNEIAPRYAAREKELNQGGGYTRILRLGARRGDAAEVAIIELI